MVGETSPFVFLFCLQGMHSLLYYLPVCDPYPNGTIMGVDVHQPYFSSADLHNYVSYGSGTLPYYSWNSTYGGDAANSSTTMHGRVKSSSGSNTSAKTKIFNNANKTNNTIGRPSNQVLVIFSWLYLFQSSSISTSFSDCCWWMWQVSWDLTNWIRTLVVHFFLLIAFVQPASIIVNCAF